jgi:transcriptional regulator with XRE-family HTH domain
MNLSENIIILRKRYGFSQEELANRLHVSRQSVSKWESGQSIPDLDRLIEMAKVFDITLDELVHGEDVRTMSTDAKEFKQDIKQIIHDSFGYEYVSRMKIGNIPLVHINVGRGMRVAKGLLAIGNIAIGIISLGGLSIGLLSLAGLGIGVFAFGGLAMGVFVLGGLAIGYLAIGGVAIGINAIGAIAIAKDVALGAISRGTIAIGASPKGDYTLITNHSTTALEVKNFISQYVNGGVVREIIFYFLS